MKKLLLTVVAIVAIVSCNNSNLIIPPEYEMLIGKWESSRFVYDDQFPGSHGNNYFITEEFLGDSLPYKLTLILCENSWEVLSDETFLCGDKIEGFEVDIFGNFYIIYLLKNKKRNFCISYKNSEIFFMTTTNNGILTDYATVYLNRIN